MSPINLVVEVVTVRGKQQQTTLLSFLISNQTAHKNKTQNNSAGTEAYTMASDLDNTRRGSAPNNTKPSDDSDQNGAHSDSGAKSLPQHVHQRTHSFPNVRHEKKYCTSATKNNGLDGELSGLQKAATKTALPPSFNRGFIATEKEEDEQYLHRGFHRHVGFTTDARNNSKTKARWTQVK